MVDDSDEDFPPDSSFGRYTGLQLIGKGGMGRVYKAYDPTLDRSLALKFIHRNDPDLRARLRLEARAQAKIDHEHICRVYEVAEIDGKLYIAMQFIPGKTLHDAGHLLSLQQKVKVVIVVAEAIHAAHRAGLIHRDIKPANILVQLDEEGNWIPYVTDFGLAREIEAPGLTVSGMVIGSPLYMPPEQARGETHKVDYRSDVYSLGVTLYELLSGKLPYSAEGNLDALIRVIEDEPKPLRSVLPAVPADLETITMKCLEKDPDRRYDSVKSLGDDLRRFLDGEPIRATPASIHYRLWRKASKHKPAVVLLLLLVCVTLALAGWALRTKWQAQRQVYWMNQFNQEAQYLDSFMKYAYTSPLHNISDEKAQALLRLHEIEKKIEEEGAAAGGPGHYALGRGYMALADHERGRAHLETAWNRYNYQTPDVAYALGLSLVELHRKELSKADRIPDQQKRDLRMQELHRLYRVPALEMINRGKVAQAEAVEYIEALVAFMDREYERAIEKAGESVKKVPWYYPADKLRGDAYSQLGERVNNEGKTQEALRFYRLAELAYEEAIRKAPSFYPVYEELAINAEAIIEVKIYQTNESFREEADRALKACNSAIVIDPQNPTAFRLKSTISWRMGEHLLYQDQDPRPILSEAMESARTAIRLDPENALAYGELGVANDLFGRYELAHGMDASRSLQESVKAHSKTVEFNPNTEFTHNGLGNAYLFLGIYKNSRGQDSTHSLDQALASYQRASQFGRNLFGIYCNQGLTFLALAEQEWNRAGNPEAFLMKAIENARQCIQLSPNFAYCHRILGNAFFSKGEYELKKGLSPEASIQSARTALQQGLQVNRGFNQTWLYAGKLEILEARWKSANGKSPAENLRKAKETLLEAIRISPDYAEAHAAIAELDCLQAEWHLSQRQPAAKAISEGLTRAEKALSLHPSLATAKATRAHLYWLQAEALNRQEPALKALASLDQAFQINPLLRNHYGELQKKIENRIGSFKK